MVGECKRLCRTAVPTVPVAPVRMRCMFAWVFGRVGWRGLRSIEMVNGILEGWKVVCIYITKF